MACKYYQTDELQKMIDWNNLMIMPRYAGGHDSQMTGLFKESTLIAHWNEGGYDGMVATCVMLSDGKFAIYNDYYGSCSGCDSWEDASDDSVRSMCINLANSAYVFESINNIVAFLKSDTKDGYSWSSASKGLLEEILQNQSIIRDIKIENIIS